MASRNNLPPKEQPKRTKAKTTSQTRSPRTPSTEKKAPQTRRSVKTSNSQSRQTQPESLDLAPEELRSRIATRAYQLCQERCRYGAEVQDWLMAEREVLGKQ